MFTDLRTLNGGVFSIRTAMVVRFRPTFGAVEPPNATKIDYGNDTFYSADSPTDIQQKVIGELRIARLHTPNALPVYLNAEKVTTVSDANEGQHHPDARAVVAVGGLMQQVNETRDEATKILAAALPKGS